ncbi:MAG: acyltransferase, partial [Microthrixaceae bacterium]
SSTWALRGGFLGVDVFLGLSAFLIAAVLLRELDENRIRGAGARFDIGGYAKRRVRRLYPAMLLLLVVSGIVAVALIGRDMAERVRQSLPAVASLANWQSSWGDPLPFELVHLWSLSLEAQFYLIMALGFWFGRRHLDRPRALVSTLVVAALLVALWRNHLLDAGVPLEDLYQRTDTRADSMLLGVAAALSWRSRLLGERAARVLGSLAAVGLGLAFVLVEVDSVWLYRGGFTLVAAAAALVVMSVASGPGVLSTLAGAGFLRWVGEVSYSLYLWHLPVFVWTVMLLGDRSPLLLKAPIALAASPRHRGVLRTGGAPARMEALRSRPVQRAQDRPGRHHRGVGDHRFGPHRCVPGQHEGDRQRAPQGRGPRHRPDRSARAPRSTLLGPAADLDRTAHAAPGSELQASRASGSVRPEDRCRLERPDHRLGEVLEEEALGLLRCSGRPPNSAGPCSRERRSDVTDPVEELPGRNGHAGRASEDIARPGRCPDPRASTA